MYDVKKQFLLPLIATILGLIALTSLPVLRNREEMQSILTLIPSFFDYISFYINYYYLNIKIELSSFILNSLCVASVIAITVSQYTIMFSLINKKYRYNIFRLIVILELALLYTSFYHTAVDNRFASTSTVINTIIVVITMVAVNIRKHNLKSLCVLYRISLLCIPSITIFLISIFKRGDIFTYTGERGMSLLHYLYDITFIIFIAFFLVVSIIYSVNKKTKEIINEEI